MTYNGTVAGRVRLATRAAQKPVRYVRPANRRVSSVTGAGWAAYVRQAPGRPLRPAAGTTSDSSSRLSCAATQITEN